MKQKYSSVLHSKCVLQIQNLRITREKEINAEIDGKDTIENPSYAKSFLFIPTTYNIAIAFVQLGDCNRM